MTLKFAPKVTNNLISVKRSNSVTQFSSHLLPKDTCVRSGKYSLTQIKRVRFKIQYFFEAVCCLLNSCWRFSMGIYKKQASSGHWMNCMFSDDMVLLVVIYYVSYQATEAFS